MEPIDIVGLIGNIRAECTDDFVGLWSIVRDVRETVGDDPATVKRFTINVLTLLLEAHEISAGNPSQDGKNFQAWSLSPEAAMNRIVTEWEQLGRDPDLGEIVWFSRTTANERVPTMSRSTAKSKKHRPG